MMHADRETTGHVGRLALKGQGSCHGCASLMASFLYHFSNLLGWDVKYRSGVCQSSGTPVDGKKDGHQVVEITMRPSM